MRLALPGLFVLAAVPLTLAQVPAAAPAPPSVSRSLGLHAYPAKDQTAAQQQKDELECYRWAAQDSGFDPLAAVGEQPAPAPPAATQDGPSTAGGAAKGAVAGAAAGALIGAIAGDTGKGAGIGAGTGLLGGVLIAKHKQHKQKDAQAEADREQASPPAATTAETQQKLAGFKKAYGACMEAKSYVVK
jgi:hypothetical protein